MTVPLRFFVGLTSGVVVAFGIYFGLAYWQMGAPTKMSHWVYTVNTRKQTRAASIREPKFVIVGGSGALFGINARQLEAVIGVPTVNLGTHASLCTAYILHLARKASQPGDTVLLAIEYELYITGNATMNKWANPLFIDFLMASDSVYFRSLPVGAQFNLTMRLPFERLKLGVKSKLHSTPPMVFREYSAYDPQNVDDYGDMTGHTRIRIPPLTPAEFPPSRALADGLTETFAGLTDIREFIDWAKTNGVRVLATFPNLCADPAYNSPKAGKVAAEIETFYQSLGVPVVGNYRDAMLPRSEFYDTHYHLTEEGATARTLRLVSRLKLYFPPKNP